MRLISTTFATYLAVALAAPPALATSGVAPPITRESTIGIWEGIVPDEPRLFVMEVADPGKPSFIAVNVASHMTMLFRADSIQVSRGRITAKAVGLGDATGYGVRIEGKGRAFDLRGHIQATVALTDGKGRRLNAWEVRFVNLKGNYIATLKVMSDVVAQAIVTEKRRLTGR